ncbi:hypothetical protein AB4Y88_17435 [Paenarthrobacter sp. RAF9]
MDHRPERTASFQRAGIPLRALLLALVVAVVPVAALAASNGQGNNQGNGQGNAAASVKGITVTLSPSSRTVDQGQSLQISNPQNKSIAVTNLSMEISQVVRTSAAVAANLPCTAADYQVTQYSGAYPLTVEPGTRSLSGLGVAQAKWPQIKMLDTNKLQDGCKGATLQLTYTGTGQAN